MKKSALVDGNKSSKGTENRPDTKGIGYKSQEGNWLKITALTGGEAKIKELGESLLPKLSGQTPAEYEEYKNRGTFYNVFSRTVQGLVGAIIRKDPEVKIQGKLEPMLSDITPQHESFNEVVRVCIQKVIEYAYHGILVDLPPQEEIREGESKLPYFALYTADSILNFRWSGNRLTMISLLEVVSQTDPENEFGTKSVQQIRVMDLDTTKEETYGLLRVRIYRKVQAGTKETWQQSGEVIEPKILGKRIDYIPFVFLGAVSNTPMPCSPPLMDLANLNVKHWQLTVDYYHGLHYCAIPTPYACGFDKNAQLFIGAHRAWVTENESAKCGFLEFTGQGLAAVKTAISDLESQMAVMGARVLIEEQKKAAEAFETVKLKTSGDSATLSTIVNSVQEGFMKAFDFAARWTGQQESGAKISLNKEFVAQKLSAQEITALLQSWQAGGMSLDTFLYQLQVGEILPPGRTIEEEKIRIEAEGKQNAKFENPGENPGAGENTVIK